MMKKVLTVVGARPQFIKAAAVSRLAASAGLHEIILHTGQHYDEGMSQVFFDELNIPRPAYNLGCGGGNHGAMTARMLAGIEEVILGEKPDWLLIYGDTNSTLAGALAAVKLHVPVAHVEAGLRSFNTRMPEEVNRILADRVSTLLFCPTDTAVRNLRTEGIANGVHQVGDVMFDVSLYYRDLAQQRSSVCERLGLRDGSYVLATCHRAENTDDSARLAGIADALGTIANELPVILPLHPRTRGVLEASAELRKRLGHVRIIDPVGYLDMLRLEQSAAAILTDSGGMQKEAFFYGVPCITLRQETEWAETVDLGWNTLCGANAEKIIHAWRTRHTGTRSPSYPPYGNGDAAQRIVDVLLTAGCQADG